MNTQESPSFAPRRTLVEWLLGGVDDDVPTSRVAVALDLEEEQPWDDWLHRAADTLGWEAERLEASPRCVEGAQDRWWVTCAGEPERWVVLTGTRGHPLRASVIDAHTSRPLPVDQERLAEELGLAGPDEVVPWIRLAPRLPLASLRSPEGTRLSPWQRLRRWVSIEREAVAAVVGYSAVIGLVSLALPLAVQSLVDLLAFSRVLQPLIIVALGLLLVLILAAALRVVEVYIVELLQRRIFSDVARDIARCLPTATHEAGGKWGLTERVNRMFDVVGMQKSASLLLLSATEVVMSAAAGLLILAFYHPYLLAFDVVLLASLGFVVWRLGRGGVDTAVHESHAKYEVAAWLESIARQQRRFFTPIAAGWSARQTDQLVVGWLERRRDHFRIVLRQTIGFAAIQALASGILLGLGSFLVFHNQLSLGQLVAAELIITGVLAQLAKFGKHVESFYDLNASVDKIGSLLDLDTERQTGDLLTPRPEGMAIDVTGMVLEERACDVVVEPGDRVVITDVPRDVRRRFFDCLYGSHPRLESHVRLDGVRMDSLAPRPLRQQVSLVRHPMPVGGTVEDNITSQNIRSTPEELRGLLDAVGLTHLYTDTREGLQAWIHPDGAPLARSQLIAMDLARVLHVPPRLLLIDGALDELEPRGFEAVWGQLDDPEAPWTLLVASDDPAVVDRFPRRYAWRDRGLVEA